MLKTILKTNRNKFLGKCITLLPNTKRLIKKIIGSIILRILSLIVRVKEYQMYFMGFNIKLLNIPVWISWAKRVVDLEDETKNLKQ